MRKQSGFTLMEALVVLMLVSVVVSLAFEMLGAYRIAKSRVFDTSAATDRRALVETWFADSIRGLVALEGAMPSGTSTLLAGVTLSPAMSPSGGPVPVEWELVADLDRVDLVYREHGLERWRVPTRAAPGAALFSYAGPDGQLTDRWPPALGVQGELPRLVVLALEGQDGGGQLVVSPRSGTLTRAEAFELETD